MAEGSAGQEICVCGFGTDYFKKKNGKLICTVCDGLVTDAVPVAEEIGKIPAKDRKTVLIIDDRDSFRHRIVTMLSTVELRRLCG